ncbi:hypothetical protein [Spiroplasma endosymbiont of Clivina fossor]|uniref:hypothetical protein n=1 Tax=Spiroplasma endosymbiont of Clivina fossor TaxID=3066282 RepID=UPI00313DBDEE
MNKNKIIINEEIFEDYIQNELISLEWNELLDKNLKRADNQETINFSVLKKSIIKINNVDSIIADKAINEIRKISDSLLEMNIKATKLLREGIKIYDSNEDRTLTINLISEDITINNYQTFFRRACPKFCVSIIHSEFYLKEGEQKMTKKKK